MWHDWGLCWVAAIIKSIFRPVGCYYAKATGIYGYHSAIYMRVPVFAAPLYAACVFYFILAPLDNIHASQAKVFLNTLYAQCGGV